MPPILQRPEPEIETLSWSPQRPPSTSDRREIEKGDRVRRLKPDLKRVIWSQVTIQNPPLLSTEQLLLDLHPSVAWSRDKAWPPDDLVEFHYREPRYFDKAHREGGQRPVGRARGQSCQWSPA